MEEVKKFSRDEIIDYVRTTYPNLSIIAKTKVYIDVVRNQLREQIFKLENENKSLKEAFENIKQFAINEIIERRDYSASKAYEQVLDEIRKQEEACYT